MDNLQNLQDLKTICSKYKATLVAVSKTRLNGEILMVYNTGQRAFGENKVQELAQKHESLPKDIQWHMIGHLQRNKVKIIAPFVSMIHAVDSVRLAKEINKQALECNRTINILLQVYIADENTKFGFDYSLLKSALASGELLRFKNITICGLMGMATYTRNEQQIKSEFQQLKKYFDEFKSNYFKQNDSFREISMGMSGDYTIALEEGSTMIRVGSAIFDK